MLACMQMVGKAGMMVRAGEQKRVESDNLRGQRHAHPRARQAKMNTLGIREG
jgi:hypothetical protein